jgi:hypothetical protein
VRAGPRLEVKSAALKAGSSDTKRMQAGFIRSWLSPPLAKVEPFDDGTDGATRFNGGENRGGGTGGADGSAAGLAPWPRSRLRGHFGFIAALSTTALRPVTRGRLRRRSVLHRVQGAGGGVS